MNDEKRKNARLQGRFSDEHRSSRKEKQKRLSDQSEEKGKSREPKVQQSPESSGVQYDKEADKSFKQYEEKVKPVEINSPGEHILSQTENGKSRILFEPDFIPKEEADVLMTIIQDATKWYDKNIIIHGQEYPQPRLVAWYGPLPYAYSGAVLEPAEMTPVITKIRDRVENYLKEKDLDVTLNSVLLNLYRNEKDSVAWHSDDELSLGCCPTIASVSLGAVRKFQMKMKPNMQDKAKNLVSSDYFVNLPPGSLIVMDGCMQKDWKHQVPKEYHDRPPRINLTFRTVYSADKLKEPTSQVPLETTNTEKINITEEERKPIFDNSNFPPLNVTTSQDKNKSEKPQKLLSDSKSNGKSAENVQKYFSNQQDQISASDSSVEENIYSNTGDSEASKTEKLSISASKNEKENRVSQISNTNSVNEPKRYNSDSASVALNNDVVKTTLPSQQDKVEVNSSLNAEAVEFVPKFHSFSNESSSQTEVNIQKLDITDLLDLFENEELSDSQLREFFDAICDYFDDNDDIFADRDYHELSVFREINDGNQTVRNQRVILKRLCSLVRYRMRKNGLGIYRPTQNRTVHRESNRPWRGSSYRGSNYKGKRNYND